MKKITVILSLSLLFCLTGSYAQKGYIVKDSALTAGVRFLTGVGSENSFFIRIDNRGKLEKYFPEDISEFGFKNGRTFFSKEIEYGGKTQKVFLERIAEGEPSVYYFNAPDDDRYYLDKKGTWIELNKDNWKDVLTKELGNCAEMPAALDLVRYNPKSMSNLMDYYYDCKGGPFPYTKKGIALGASSTSLSTPVPFEAISANYLLQTEFDQSTSFMAGLYLDIPISKRTLSLGTGLFYNKATYEQENVQVVNLDGTITEVDVNIEFNALTIPILFKYSLPIKKIRPFVGLGPSLSYHLSNAGEIATSDTSTVIISDDNGSEEFLSSFYLGYSANAGVFVDLKGGKGIIIEARYDEFLDNDNFLSKSNLMLFCAFTF